MPRCILDSRGGGEGSREAKHRDIDGGIMPGVKFLLEI